MRAKMGNEFPKRGNSLPLSGVNSVESPYEAVVAMALRRELRGSRQAIKTLMRWTGASSRTAKNWLSGAAGPSGAHLVELMRTSDVVFETVLKMVGREQVLTSASVAEALDLVRRVEALLADER